MQRLRIIGAGNPDRGDDGVGRFVAKFLLSRNIPGVNVVEAGGEATEILALLEATSDAVWIVDACQLGASAGTVHRFDLARMCLPQNGLAASTHGFGVGQAIELAQAFGNLPKHCVVFAVEAQQFELGSGLSAPLAEAAVSIAESIETEIAAFKAQQSRSA